MCNIWCNAMNNINWGKIIEMEEISKVLWSKKFIEGIDTLRQKETCLKPHNWLVPKSEFIKNLPVMQEKQEMRAQCLDQEDPLEEEMATDPSILAWRIPRTEEPGGLQSTGSQRVTRLSVWTHRCVLHVVLLDAAKLFSKVIEPVPSSQRAPVAAHPHQHCRCVASVGSDSGRPHRRQPTRLLRPWDSPGKSTGVGYHQHWMLSNFKAL